MQKFENGSPVRVVSLDRTEEVCGLSLSTSMASGARLEVLHYDGNDDTYHLSDRCWYSAVDLEAFVEAEPVVEDEPVAEDKELIIEDFGRRDTVQLLTTNNTNDDFGYDRGEHVVVGETFVVDGIDEYDDSVSDEAGNWYAIADLVIVSKDDNTYLSLDEVEVGDEVRIITLTRTEDTFGESHELNVGDTFTVKDTDTDDDTVYTGYDWIYVEELALVDSEVIDDSYEVGGIPETPEATDEVEDEVNYLITRDSVTLSIDGDSEVATSDHVNFMAIRANVLAGEFDEAMALMNVSIGIQNWGQGLLTIEDGKILYSGMELTGKLVDRIIDQMVNGDTAFERFAKFLNLTMEQESFKTRARLMDFAAHDKLDINEDGYVVAFKNVRDDYFDKHSGKFDNHVGKSPSLPRHMVNDDHETTCAAGLHVCSPEYLSSFWGTSGKTMRVVVDPRDFVAIPYDYNDSKARVCRYSVVEDVTDRMSDYL